MFRNAARTWRRRRSVCQSEQVHNAPRSKHDVRRKGTPQRIKKIAGTIAGAAAIQSSGRSQNLRAEQQQTLLTTQRREPQAVGVQQMTAY